jgi:hypothetical protein
VKVAGENPFPWDVKICYKGLKILRGMNKTEVIFQNGKSVIITDTESKIISL